MTYATISCLFYASMFLYKIILALTIADKGILPLQRNSVAIQLFIDIKNKNCCGTCKVYSKIRKCCLIDANGCDLIDVHSAQMITVEARRRKRLIYIFPSIYQHDLIGYCDISLIYRCRRKAGILNVHIPFDTRVDVKPRSKTLFKDYTDVEKGSVCESTDQDSLKECSPINCDVKYNGKRIFYDEALNKCIETPVCVANSDEDLPNVVYESQLNVCKDLDVQLSVQDINTLSTGLGVVTQKKINQDKPSKIEFKSNCSTISQNLLLLKDLACGKLCPCKEMINLTDLCKNALICIIFSILSVSVGLLSCVCCVHTSVWLLTQWLDGNVKDFIINIRSKFKRNECPWRCQSEVMDSNHNILLRDIVIKGIPLELRDSVVDDCERLQSQEVYNTNRFERVDFNSKICLQE